MSVTPVEPVIAFEISPSMCLATSSCSGVARCVYCNGSTRVVSGSTARSDPETESTARYSESFSSSVAAMFPWNFGEPGALPRSAAIAPPAAQYPT